MCNLKKRKWTTGLFSVLFGISVIGAQPLERMEIADSESPGKILLTMLETQFSSNSFSQSFSDSEAAKKPLREKNTDLDENFQNTLPTIGNSSVAEASSEKTLYLTFDDGPLKGTGNVLRVLKEERVPATMFCVGRHARLHPELFRQELSTPDLLIANHTYSHANGHYRRFYSDTFGVLSDVEHAQIVLGGRKYLRLAGRNVWRLPELSRNDHAIVARRGFREVPKYDALSQEGYFIYGWDVEWHFKHRSGHPVESSELLAARIEALYRRGHTARQGKVVLLAHDFMFRNRHSTDELRHFIRLMKHRGWHFKTLRHYSQLTPQPLHIAKYYGKKRRTLLTSTDQKSISPSPVVPLKRQHTAANSHSTVSKSLPAASSRAPRSPEALLSDAVRHYDALNVDRLIRKGVPLNRIDEFGRTALNTAVRANSLVLVKKLLASGASSTLRDGSGITPLQMARRYKRRAIEAYLIRFTLRDSAPAHLSQTGKTRNVPIAIAQPNRINPLKLLSQANRSNPIN